MMSMSGVWGRWDQWVPWVPVPGRAGGSGGCDGSGPVSSCACLGGNSCFFSRRKIIAN